MNRALPLLACILLAAAVWVLWPSGEAHVYGQGLITQGPRELVAPPSTIALASMSHGRRTPEDQGEPTSRLSSIRGEWVARREQEDGSFERFPPGFYDVHVAPRNTSTNESRFFPWRTIEIRSQPSQPSPGSAGSGN